jgi:hypothetical protein
VQVSLGKKKLKTPNGSWEYFQILSTSTQKRRQKLPT